MAERFGLADDRDDRDVVELRVVEPVEQVHRPGPARRGADPDVAGELRVADGLECRHLLMPRLDELRLVLGPPPGGEQPVDAVARVAEHLLDVPFTKPRQQYVGNRVAHCIAPLRHIAGLTHIATVSTRNSCILQGNARE